MSQILMALHLHSLDTFDATVVIAGIVIVVAMLILLIIVFSLFGMLVSKMVDRAKVRAEKKAAKKAQKNGVSAAPAPVNITPAPMPKPAPIVEQGISGEIVAAITAAVVATEGSGAVIHSIKKKNVSGRNPWAAAAVSDNTRPF